jgi:hypothetical protein
MSHSILRRTFIAILAIVPVASSAQTLVGNDAKAVASDVTSGTDNGRIVFVTQEQLVPEDNDNGPDIYVRYTPTNGEPVTELVSRDDSPPFEGSFWQAVGARRGLVYGRAEPNSSIFVFVRSSGGQWLRGTAIDESRITPMDILNDGSLIITAFANLVDEDDNLSCDLYRIPPPRFLFGTLLTPQPELLTPSGASTLCPTYGGGFVTPSGEVRVIFSTERPLIAADRDAGVDVYARVANTYRLLSRPLNGAQFANVNATITTSAGFSSQEKDDFGDAVSPEADTVLFRTSEPLVGADTDAAADFYVGRLNSTPVLIPGNGVPKLVVNGFVFFESSAQLAGNLDSDIDVFRMSLATREIVHVSRSRSFMPIPFPGQEVATADASFIGASELGDRAWFRSSGSFGVAGTTPSFESVATDDLFEANLDLEPGSASFLRCFTLNRADAPGLIFGDVFTPVAGTAAQHNSMFLGRTVLFRSIRQLAATETTDAGHEDIYAFGATSPRLQLVTTPTSGTHPESSNLPAVLGFGGTPSRGAFDTLQPDRGTDPFTVVFETKKRLAATDTDDALDVYVRDLLDGTTTHVSLP